MASSSALIMCMCLVCAEAANISHVRVMPMEKGMEDMDSNDGTQEIMTDSQTYKAFIIITMYVRPSICSLGIVFNVIGICVLLHKTLRHSSYQYLLALMVADSGYLLCGLVDFLSHYMATTNIHENYFIQRVYPVVRIYLEAAFAKVSNYIVCLLGVERLVAITHPFKSKHSILSKHSGKVNVIIFIIIFTFYIPRAFSEELVHFQHTETNTTVFEVLPVDIARNDSLSIFFNIYRDVIIVLFVFIPPFFLLVVNIAIVTHLWRIHQNRKSLFAGKNSAPKMSFEQMKMTVILLIISGFFFVVFSLIICENIMRRYFQDTFGLGQREENLARIVSLAAKLGWTINSANDFLVYVVHNPCFRKKFLEMFCCRSDHGKVGSPRCSLSTTSMSFKQEGTVRKSSTDVSSDFESRIDRTP